MLEKSGGSKIFTIADRSEFARLSGDHNSMHMDDIAARRTRTQTVVTRGQSAVFVTLGLSHESLKLSEPGIAQESAGLYP